MESEDAIIGDFLYGGLTRDGAIGRLVGMGLTEKDADRLLDEAVESTEDDEQANT